MAGPVDSTQFDPNRTPFTSPAPRFTYIDLPLYGTLMVNSDTKQIHPIPGGTPLPGVPIRLPQELMAVPQPHVKTCGPHQGAEIGRGCTSCTNGTCPIYNQFGRVGPVNLIVEKHGRVDSIPCHLYYSGVTASGRPAAGAGYALDGWRVLTDRTTTKHNVMVIEDGKKRNTVVEMEVQNLAPFYDHLKKPAEAPKKKGKRSAGA